MDCGDLLFIHGLLSEPVKPLVHHLVELGLPLQHGTAVPVMLMLAVRGRGVGKKLRVDGEMSIGCSGQTSDEGRLDPGAGFDVGEEVVALAFVQQAVTHGARVFEGFHFAGGAFNTTLFPLVLQNLIQR